MDVVEFPKSRSTKIEGNKERHVKETWRRYLMGWPLPRRVEEEDDKYDGRRSKYGAESRSMREACGLSL
ncbi:hypothetical protein ANTQUA_LOCUS6580 [Anthophora quadrimaculata]